MNIGDKVECGHDADWQAARRNEDIQRWNEPGLFISNGSAYMHLDEAYIIEAITPDGDLKLRGLAVPVSIEDVRISTKPVYR